VITDEVTVEIAAAIVSELQTLGAPYRAWVLEDLAERPLKDLPAEILAEQPPENSVAPQADTIGAKEALAARPIYAEATARTPGKATIAERYPLLRNAL